MPAGTRRRTTWLGRQQVTVQQLLVGEVHRHAELLAGRRRGGGEAHCTSRITLGDGDHGGRVQAVLQRVCVTNLPEPPYSFTE